MCVEFGGVELWKMLGAQCLAAWNCSTYFVRSVLGLTVASAETIVRAMFWGLQLTANFQQLQVLKPQCVQCLGVYNYVAAVA